MGLSLRCHKIFCLLTILLPLVFTDCARNPFTGKRQVVLISESQEIGYGQQAHPQILAELGKTEDAALDHSAKNLTRNRLSFRSVDPEIVLSLAAFFFVDFKTFAGTLEFPAMVALSHCR